MFPCEKCGCCCRLAGRFPIDGIVSPDGICQHLDKKTNLCTIYEKRPIFCNVDASYEAYYKERMSREEFYELNKKECLRLQKKFGIQPDYSDNTR